MDKHWKQSILSLVFYSLIQLSAEVKGQNNEGENSLVMDEVPSCTDGFIFDSPYNQPYSYRYKVNLHGHTTHRGEEYAFSPEELLRNARDYGFDAFAITDLPHAGGIVSDPGLEGILHIPGIEYGGTPHLIGLGIRTLTNSNRKQEQIDHIKKQNGIVYIAHPYWGGYDEDILGELEHYDGIAVFNSLTYGVAIHEGRAEEVILFNEAVLDSMLISGRKPAIIAEEDTKYEDPHRYGHQLNTAWVEVWSNVPKEEITVDEILRAIKERRFTSHARHLRNHPTPPVFMEIVTNGLTLRIKTDKKSDIAFVTSGGKVKKTVRNAVRGSYKATLDDIYVRIRAVSHNKQSEYSWAWTNAVFIDCPE